MPAAPRAAAGGAAARGDLVFAADLAGVGGFSEHVWLAPELRDRFAGPVLDTCVVSPPAATAMGVGIPFRAHCARPFAEGADAPGTHVARQPLARASMRPR